MKDRSEIWAMFYSNLISACTYDPNVSTFAARAHYADQMMVEYDKRFTHSNYICEVDGCYRVALSPTSKYCETHQFKER